MQHYQSHTQRTKGSTQLTRKVRQLRHLHFMSRGGEGRGREFGVRKQNKTKNKTLQDALSSVTDLQSEHHVKDL